MNFSDQIAKCLIAGLLAGSPLLAVGCAARSDSAAETKTTVPETPRSATRNLAPPSINQCRHFAEAFQAAIYRGDNAAASDLINWNALLETAVEGVPASEQFRESFLEGARRETRKGDFAKQLSHTVANGGSFRLLRVRSMDGQQRALFRHLHPDSGVNYQEFILAQDDAGEVRAIDLYIFLSAERLSQTMRRMYLLAAAEQTGTQREALQPRDNDFLEHAAEIRGMTRKLRSGQYREVLDLYSQLPASLQVEKTVMLIYVQAAAQVDDDVYAAAIDRFRKRHPHDTCLDIVSIDGCMLREQYDEALEAVDRVDGSVGGDPYMNVLRANVERLRGNHSMARTFAQRAIAEEPQLIDAHWALVSISLDNQEFAETARCLTTIREQFDVKFGDLSTLSDYTDFVKSPEFERWRQTQSTPTNQVLGSNAVNP